MILKRLLLLLSCAAWAEWMAKHAPGMRQLAQRFVAGETADEAITAIRMLNADQITATVDYLGEHVSTPVKAVQAADGYLLMLNKILNSGVHANISLKLTQLGLDLNETLCLEQIQRILKKAVANDIFIRIDMESSHYTDRTLAICRQLNREFGPGRVGVVIQASLYRSEQDLRQLLAEQIGVRLCKGAYLEPPDRGYPHKADVDANYIHLAQHLLQQASEQLSNAIATHDHQILHTIMDYASHQRVNRKHFEFQMLYGVRRQLQRELVAKGYRVRVYVPYGREWDPYLMRRLAERPANLWFFLSHIFKH